jgi:DNA adenine methylase
MTRSANSTESAIQLKKISRYNTPLRYPGGKQKLAPFMLELMVANNLCGGHYVEPYAGGAGIAIDLLLRGKVEHVHLNDSCFAVYAFWKSILTQTNEFCRRIANATMTIEEWRRQREIILRQSEFDQIDVGFSMFYLNRCNRSGIVASGGVIGGLRQDGDWKMDARFPRNELIRRIELIALNKNSITLKNWDAEKFILRYLPTLPERTLVYCDPPYFHQSKRLYLNHYGTEDHARIARIIQRNIKLPWVVSYDNARNIVKCYERQRFFMYNLQYHAARSYKGREVFFFSKDLRLPATSTVRCLRRALLRFSKSTK